jgi:hypothetical protein
MRFLPKEPSVSHGLALAQILEAHVSGAMAGHNCTHTDTITVKRRLPFSRSKFRFKDRKGKVRQSKN